MLATLPPALRRCRLQPARRPGTCRQRFLPGLRTRLGDGHDHDVLAQRPQDRGRERGWLPDDRQRRPVLRELLRRRLPDDQLRRAGVPGVRAGRRRARLRQRQRLHRPQSPVCRSRRDQRCDARGRVPDRGLGNRLRDDRDVQPQWWLGVVQRRHRRLVRRADAGFHVARRPGRHRPDDQRSRKRGSPGSHLPDGGRPHAAGA